MPKVSNDDTRTTSIGVIRVSWDQCDTPHITIICQKTFCTIKTVSYYYHFQQIFLQHQSYVWLSDRFKILVCFVEMAIRRCTKNMCLKYVGKILEKNLFFQSSGDSSSVTADIGGVFSIWPNITPQKSLRCGIMMGHWLNITLVPANLYPKYGVMVGC